VIQRGGFFQIRNSDLFHIDTGFGVLNPLCCQVQDSQRLWEFCETKGTGVLHVVAVGVSLLNVDRTNHATGVSVVNRVSEDGRGNIADSEELFRTATGTRFTAGHDD